MGGNQEPVKGILHRHCGYYYQQVTGDSSAEPHWVRSRDASSRLEAWLDTTLKLESDAGFHAPEDVPRIRGREPSGGNVAPGTKRVELQVRFVLSRPTVVLVEMRHG